MLSVVLESEDWLRIDESHRVPKLNIRRTSHFLGLNRSTSVLLAAMVLIASGEEMWMRFVPKYLEVLGASAFLIGAYDALKTLLGACTPGPAVSSWIAWATVEF